MITKFSLSPPFLWHVTTHQAKRSTDNETGNKQWPPSCLRTTLWDGVPIVIIKTLGYCSTASNQTDVMYTGSHSAYIILCRVYTT